MPKPEVIELLLKHRSIRRFKPQALEQGTLESLVQAGQAASTSSFIQATSVVRISDLENRQSIAELAGGQGYVASASEFLVLCADLQRNQQCIRNLDSEANPDFSWTEQFIAATVDVALFAQNMVIAAESLGLGCCYIGGIRNNPDKINQLLQLPALVYPIFGLCIGHPDQDPAVRPRLPVSAVLHENQYSAQCADTIAHYDDVIRDYYSQRSRGKLDFSWSEQMTKQAATQSRPFMKDFINNKGLALK